MLRLWRRTPAPGGAISGLPALEVGPIGFADYLKRHAIVTQRADHTYDVAKLELWGGSLEEEFQHALYKNLLSLLPQHRLQLSSSVLGGEVDLRLKAEVYRFDFSAQSVRLEAEWGWYNIRNQRVSAGRFYQTRQAGASMEGNVRLMSELVSNLAREVATGLPKP